LACIGRPIFQYLVSRQNTLQEILEALAGKLIAQGRALNTITSEFGTVASPGGVLDRLRLLENRLDELLGPPGSDSQLSPFKQKDTLDRLEILESTVAQQRRNLLEIQHDNEKV
jgi:hypothetical protein